MEMYEAQINDTYQIEHGIATVPNNNSFNFTDYSFEIVHNVRNISTVNNATYDSLNITKDYNYSLFENEPSEYILKPNLSRILTTVDNILLNDNLTGNISSNFNQTSHEFLANNHINFRAYWAFALLVFPMMAVFGNVLVILGVVREKNLQTVTNYFIISLAFADLLVAVAVMPFGVYALVTIKWGLGDLLCDMYIAIDVTCSTASIFNLVAISIDRYIAITKPITYAEHKQSKVRVALTISVVWVASSLIASPIVLGLNNTPERDHETCAFYNSDFIIYSSLVSFFIPCILMIFLYYKIFSVIHKRATRKSQKREIASKSCMIDASNQILSQDERTSSRKKKGEKETKFFELPVVEVEPPTYHGDVIAEEHKICEQKLSPTSSLLLGQDRFKRRRRSSAFIQIHGTIDECKIIPNTQLSLSPTYNQVVRRRSSLDKDFISTISVQVSTNEMTTDSGYVPSNMDLSPVLKTPPINELNKFDDSIEMFSTAMCPSSTSNETADSQTENITSETQSIKKSNIPTFAIAMMTSNLRRRRREKNTARKERKATKTLAIVIGVFLACWVPFFTCNVLTAVCMKLNAAACISGVELFMATTWLGYINSCLNPIIYTVFNMEFRKAFKKLLLNSC